MQSIPDIDGFEPITAMPYLIFWLHGLSLFCREAASSNNRVNLDGKKLRRSCLAMQLFTAGYAKRYVARF